MLHNEARALAIADYERTHDAATVAAAFGISKWTLYHMVAKKQKTGISNLQTSQRGRKPVLSDTDKTRICNCIDETPDITIEEIIEKLSLSASYSTVERVVISRGYTLKKKSLHATEQERSRCERKAQKVGK